MLIAQQDTPVREVPHHAVAPIVAYDMDEVLCNIREHSLNSLCAHSGQYLHWSQWADYAMYESFGLSWEQYSSILIEERILERALPEEGAREVVAMTRELGCRNVVITSRGFHPRGAEVTTEWLDGHRYPVDEVVVVSSGHEKAAVFTRLASQAPVLAFVDDHSATLDAVRACNVLERLVLRDRRWNRNEMRYQRIHDIREYGDIVRRVVAKRNRLGC